MLYNNFTTEIIKRVSGAIFLEFVKKKHYITFRIYSRPYYLIPIAVFVRTDKSNDYYFNLNDLVR